MKRARETGGWFVVLGLSLLALGGCATPGVATAPPRHAATLDLRGPVAADVPEPSDGDDLPSKVRKVTGIIFVSAP